MTLHYITLHYITLHYITSFCIASHCIVQKRFMALLDNYERGTGVTEVGRGSLRAVERDVTLHGVPQRNVTLRNRNVLQCNAI